MPLFYLDTSALVKRYIGEEGSDVVDELFDKRGDADFLVISLMAFLELKSAFKRLAKGRTLSESQVSVLLSEFSSDQSAIYGVLNVDARLIGVAGALMDRHTLRAGDALHLASILQLQSAAQDSKVIVVASDEELCAACSADGFEVLNPEDERATERLAEIRATV